MSRIQQNTKNQAGFGIVEMMISLTIGLVILTAVSGVMLNSAGSARTNDKAAEVQTNGRFALDLMRRDIQHAGYAGLTKHTTHTNLLNNGSGNVTITGTCGGAFSVDLENPLEGGDDTATVTAANGSCTVTGRARGDVVSMRYVDLNAQPATANALPTSAVQGDVYFRSTYEQNELFQISNSGVAPASITVPPMQDHLLVSNVYYVASNTNGTDGIPALYRLTLKQGAMVSELVASGIDHMEVQYGVVTTVDTSATDPNIATVQFKDAPTTAEWPFVRLVRIWVLARSTQPETGYVDSNSYPMGNQTYQPNDNFRRQLFITTVKLRNL